MSITVTQHHNLHSRLINIMKAFLVQNFYLPGYILSEMGITNHD